MVLSLLLVFTSVLIPNTSAEDCHYELYTQSPVRHINYTGRPCRWTIIAPESQRIWFTLQKLTVQMIDGQCTSMLTVYDEESAAPQLCRNISNAMEYISDRNRLHLNITNVFEATSITTIEAIFHPAVQYFSCDFNPNSDCTRQVQQTSWMYSVGGNNLCLTTTPNEDALVPTSGVFYQAASVPATLRIASLPSGRYFVNATVTAGCSPFDQNQAITLTYCNRTKIFSLAPYYQRWRTGTAFIQCEFESEAKIQATNGSMVVAMDNIRLWKRMDELPVQSTTSIPSTNSLVTLDQRQMSDFPLLTILVASGSAILILIVIAAFLVCILCRRRRKTVRDAPEAPTRIHFDNRTYDTHISLQTPAVTSRSPEYAEVNRPVPAVRNNVTEGYNYINPSPNQSYEPTVVTDYEPTHQLSEDQEHTYNELGDQVAYGGPENEYQVVNKSKDAKT